MNKDSSEKNFNREGKQTKLDMFFKKHNRGLRRERSRLKKGKFIIMRNFKNINKRKKGKRMKISGSTHFICIKKPKKSSNKIIRSFSHKKHKRKDLIQLAKETIDVKVLDRLKNATNFVRIANRFKINPFSSEKNKEKFVENVVTKVDLKSKKPIIISSKKPKLFTIQITKKKDKKKDVRRSQTQKERIRRKKDKDRSIDEFTNSPATSNFLAPSPNNYKRKNLWVSGFSSQKKKRNSENFSTIKEIEDIQKNIPSTDFDKRKRVKFEISEKRGGTAKFVQFRDNCFKGGLLKIKKTETSVEKRGNMNCLSPYRLNTSGTFGI